MKLQGKTRAPLTRLGTLLVLVATLSCVSAPSGNPDLGVTVPEDWTAANPEAQIESRITEEASWWTQFGDTNLDTLVLDALARNHDLLAAAARLEAATAQARIAGADLYPQIGAGINAARGKNNFIGLPIPGGEGQVLTVTSQSFGASLNLSWEVDLWGRLRAQKNAAVSQVSASQADYAGARLSLAGQTAKAWFAVLEARQQTELARSTVDSRRLSRERIERRYLLGTRPALELRFATTQQAAAEASLAFRQRQLDLVLRQLDLLLSRYPDGELDLALIDSSLPEPPVAIPAGLPSELVSRRPDLVAADHRLAAAGFDVKRARASLYPRLSLTGSTGTLSAEIEDLLDDDLSVWSLAGGLLQPIFQGGRLRGGVELSEARYREIAERYVQQVLRAFSEVELALAAERFLVDQERALAEAALQSIASEKLAENRYDAGLQDYLSYLEAQRNSFLAQSELLSARRQRLAARVDLYLALGGDYLAAETAADPSQGESDS
jgi:NodT family efflux transporter outer membrane factor (OMF) lipoprotein